MKNSIPTAVAGFAQKKVSGTFRRSKTPAFLGLESSRHLFLGKDAVATFLLVGLAAALRHTSAGTPPSTRPYVIDKRIPWTTSHITGSPEPPAPYRIERMFPKLIFKNPLLITSAPGTERLFVGEQAGKIYSFPKDPACSKADLFFDLSTELHGWDKNKVQGVGNLYG